MPRRPYRRHLSLRPLLALDIVLPIYPCSNVCTAPVIHVLEDSSRSTFALSCSIPREPKMAEKRQNAKNGQDEFPSTGDSRSVKICNRLVKSGYEKSPSRGPLMLLSCQKSSE